MAHEPLIATLDAARREFLALVDELRPDLHRYCARMTGSVADGEDVVQDTLARAYYELAEMNDVPPLRPWLFRIAHNRAIDHLRREKLRTTEPLDEALAVAADADAPDEALARRQALAAAVGSFLRLAPAQRACVVLKDVLDHSLEEIGTQLGLSVPAVKAALHRGRAQLRAIGHEAAAPARAVSPALARYAQLFNLRDWDGVRALLADDVKLDVVSRRKAAGRRDVGEYFGNYERLTDWHLVPAWLDGREVLAVVPPPGDGTPCYFIEIGWRDGRVEAIRDWRHVAYIGQDAIFELPG